MEQLGHPKPCTPKFFIRQKVLIFFQTLLILSQKNQAPQNFVYFLKRKPKSQREFLISCKKTKLDKDFLYFPRKTQTQSNVFIVSQKAKPPILFGETNN